MIDVKNRIVSTPDATEPVTLTEAKNYLRVTNSADDTKITAMISAARASAENYINRDIVSREREMFIVELDGEDVELQFAPLNTSSSITITIDGEETTEDSEWEKIGSDTDPYIRFSDPYARKVSITYTTAGLIDDNSAKQGVLSLLYCMYENENPKPFWSILKPLKRAFI